MTIYRLSLPILALASLLSACSPEVGSDKWCANLKDKPQGEWTIDETKGYAQHCLFK